jgi:hypothetical protein
MVAALRAATIFWALSAVRDALENFTSSVPEASASLSHRSRWLNEVEASLTHLYQFSIK